MPLHRRQNQYRGVNAHLHSSLQNEADAWGVFHGTHITLLAFEIDALLPPGYIAEPERGLQIKAYHPVSGEEIRTERIRRRKPDISIYATAQTSALPSSAPGTITAPTLEVSAIESLTLDEEAYLLAVVIRQVEETGIGKAITWIELLSPTNKPDGTGYHQYLEGRENTLRSGIALVEIDYLHQSAPVIGAIPSYPDGEFDAYPYHIAVTNPRPNLREGRLRVYGFGVDAAMPLVPIPLAGEEEIVLDFGKVYHRTFESLSAFSRRVDYEREPERFDTYTEADQQKIRQRMEAAAQTPQA
jgi:hypothetical protein